MERICITDITIRQAGKAAGYELSFRDKIELAKLLDRAGVDVIELHGLLSPRADSLLIKSIASAVASSAVCVPIDPDPAQAAAVWQALREAKRPRLQVCAPVSTVQMEYLAGKKPEALLAAVEQTVQAAAALCPEVEFAAWDATRAEPAFLARAIDCAVRAGAGIVTLCDTAGVLLPDEMSAFVKATVQAAPCLASVRLGVSCADTLSMADACAAAAVAAGAREVKAAAYRTDSVSLRHLAAVLAAKGADFGVQSGVNTTQLHRLIEQIERICRTERSKGSPFEPSAAPDSGLQLTARNTREDVVRAAARLGYDLTQEDGAKVYEAFCRIAEKKDTVGEKELDAIIAAAAMQVPPIYRLDSYVINTGNTISATAHVRLRKGDAVQEGISLGDGPIDAVFLAIEHIVGCHYELDDFQIQSVTEGREAMGQAVVRLRNGGKLYSGRGISTDIIGSAVHAYLGALNKIAYEEAGGDEV